MGFQACHFLRHIAAVCKEGNFFDDSLIIQRQRQSGFLQALEQHLAVAGGHAGGACHELLAEAAQRGNAGEEVALHVLTLLGAQGDEGLQRFAHGGVCCSLNFLQRDIGFRFLSNDAEAEQGVQRGIHRTAQSSLGLSQGGGEGGQLIAVQRQGAGAAGGLLQGDRHIYAPARYGGSDDVAHRGFQCGPGAGQHNCDFCLFAVDSANLNPDGGTTQGGCGSPESGHTIHKVILPMMLSR